MAMMKRFLFQTMAECDCDSNVCINRSYCMAERIDQLENSTHGEWRDIDTAPRDGKTVIDLHDGHDRRTDMVWQITSPMHPNGCWKKYYQSWEDVEDFFQPTHWMPIPEPPNNIE